MTDTDTTDRFVIEVSQVGTVDHIVDLEADSADGSPYAPRQDLPGEKLCDRSTRSPASEYITLRTTPTGEVSTRRHSKVMRRTKYVRIAGQR
jgi:hypothetical protein